MTARAPRVLARRALARHALALLPLAGAARVATAQAINEAGAQPLVLPLGARIVGIGGAAVAGQFGAESQLSNPAALGFATRREIALLHGQDFFPRDLLAVVFPSRRLGTFAASGYLVNLAETPATDDFGNQIGTAYVRSVSAAATYASTISRDFSLGLTYRVTQLRFDCSGTCTVPGAPVDEEPVRGTTSMVDIGAQYDFRKHAPIAVGAAIRHLGLRLQVKDGDQADPLPTQLAIGARYDVTALARRVKDTQLRVSTDIVRGLGAGGSDPALHVGAEGTFRSMIALRGGWVQRRGDSGPSVGFGYQGKRLGFDVARQLTGLAVEAGETPTYVALRYHF